ncbi:RraA family protein [Roseomonas eburnea]|uniref:Putative 4-hydroxy-4-methyl-2-oxoglutarate aldolase n=1 Tax=Neoroseomonas eburnea TaxID=1346889 RepID=A0A9X9X9X9_9PROT|nr:RraA family protein [Neoroseomonas eburnea]MBR0680515.1 RraA family protein [Neoroseomonas eburnea]
MLDNPPLLTIHRGHPRPDPALVAAFRGAQTSHLADAMDGRGALDYRIKPMDPENAVFAGPALTAFAYPADIVGVYGALAEAEPGDVIIVANDAYTTTAVIGDIVAGMMKNKGVAAFVTDGLARDRAGIVAAGLPVFAAGIMPASPAANGPGVVGAPVTLGGQHVRPGDIIVGDADGVVVVPLDRAEAVLERLAAVRAAEAKAVAQVEAGGTATDRIRHFVSAARIIGP